MQFGEGTGEFRVIGPPGCGKTHAATDIARSSAQRYGFDKVMITSFTNAAAEEIAGRADIPDENIGTLHHYGMKLIREDGSDREFYDENSHGKKGWKRRKRSDGAKNFLENFNAAYPHYAIPPSRRRGFAQEGDGGGDLLARRDVLLGRMVPQDLWPIDVTQFHLVWETAKRKANVIDYQDMMTAAHEAECAPGDPDVIIVDEAQDFTPQQIDIVRRWGRNAKQLYLVGDDDQVLYRFRGVSSDAMMNPKLEDWRYNFLSQSYRVPRKVHAAAMRWISQINPEHRLHKEYRPRDEDGLVGKLPLADYNDPEPVIANALRDLEEGRDVMVIAATHRMLQPLIQMLRRSGVPYANKYVPNDDGWNPLREDTKLMKGLLSFLIGIEHPMGVADPRHWTLGELRLWADCLKGMARTWERKLVYEDGQPLPDDLISTGGTLGAVLGDKYDVFMDALEAAARGDGSPLAFFVQNLEAAHKDKPPKTYDDIGKLRFIENILGRCGAGALVAKTTPKLVAQQPRITVGTIHSVKGGEASSVYIFPDLGKPQKEDWDGMNGVGELGRESLIRLYYVAMTRARERLIVTGADRSSYGSVDLWRYL